ncbi:formate dehydrogenase accessory sulfurtransferase FdhD [Deinococcus fonticola]|uniref:formate dehydrogenase accessory sulfurtransferase FdhD n=1 Tax=Deinococcus fonticola TaxID=2528713 RepID=UPI001F113BAA|nr:formate dehydrogenase accessory sulfurtransferase FdhD [Deinococcus fonticola]
MPEPPSPAPAPRDAAVTFLEARRMTPQGSQVLTDAVAVEEPLELRLQGGPEPLTLAVLMRTPGHDRELLLGWLVSEGLLPAEFDLLPDDENRNVWHLFTPEYARLAAGARLGVSSSACGVCGTGSIERLAIRAGSPVWTAETVEPELILGLPQRLLAAQAGFHATGGLHAAGLFSARGELRHAFEDVGRHNAVDKVVGHAAQHLPLTDQLLCVSSRAGFEIVQKAVMAGIALVVTVGAATSLAVETAQTFGVTLCAFTREGRFTVYSAPQRILSERP